MTPLWEKGRAGLEWGEVLPSHWEVRRLKHICEVFPSNVDKKAYEGDTPVLLCNYTDVYYNDRITSELRFMEATATPEQIKRFSLMAGDTIITKDSETPDDIAVAAYVPEDLPGVVCGYHLSMVRPGKLASGAFIKWLFGSRSMKASVHVRANGLTRVGLGQYALDNLVVPVPPRSEQAAIAAFLDRETGKIDALVEEQRRLIELLKEKRRTVISHAVTKGRNPNAKMKPSGLEWPSTIPANWEVLPLNRVVRKFVDYRGVTPTKLEEGVPLITATQIKNGKIDHSLDPVFISENEYAERMTRGFPEVGDVLLTTEAPLGEVAMIEDPHVSPGQRMILMKVNSSYMTNEFLFEHFRSDFGKSELQKRGSGSTATGIRADRLRASLVLVPPVEEQLSIVQQIRATTQGFEEAESLASRQIELLQERRSSLISAAVTGKIDVRQVKLGEVAA